MGKRLIQQRRGRGTTTYRVHSFRYKGAAKHKRVSSDTGSVVNLIDCPGHSAPLAEIRYGDGDRVLMIAPEGISVGDVITTSNIAPIKPGNSMMLRNIPEGTLIYNIESNPGDGGKFVRSSGTFARVLAHISKKTTVLFPSKKQRDFDSNCRASIGIVAGGGRREKPFLKAGKRYYAMKARNKLYPTVTGAAMNAVDHPFGGKRTSRKGRPTIAPKNAPPGRKVGMIRPRRTGRKKR